MSLAQRPRIVRFPRHFRGREEGSITILFGLALAVLAGLVGLAIDAARAYDVKVRVQGALDAAALASAKIMDVEDSTDADVAAAAQRYFQAQLSRLGISDLQIDNFTATPDWSTSTVATSADVRLRSIFGSLTGGSQALSFSPQSTATYRTMKIELALVADITGSMCNVPPGPADPPCTSATKLDALKNAANDLVDALFETNPGAGAVRVALVPYAASVNAGPWAAAASGGASADGCVVERSGPEAATNSPPGAYAVGAVAPGTLPFYSCVATPIRPLTDLANATARSQFRAAIASLAAAGGTAGHIGAAWGWYVLSPEWNSLWPANAAREWNPDRVLKVVVLMTDGDFNISYANGGETAPWPDPLSSDATHPGSSGHQALQLCNAMSQGPDASRNVRIYTVAFQAPAAAEALLKQCAGDANAYDANNASQLSDAFRDIVRRLNNLRVTS